MKVKIEHLEYFKRGLLVGVRKKRDQKAEYKRF